MKEKTKRDWITYLYNANASFQYSVDEETAKFNKKFRPEFHISPKIYLETQNIPDFCLEAFKKMLETQHELNKTNKKKE